MRAKPPAAAAATESEPDALEGNEAKEAATKALQAGDTPRAEEYRAVPIQSRPQGEGWLQKNRHTACTWHATDCICRPCKKLNR